MTGLLKGSMWECAGIRSVGKPQKRWNDAVKDCLKKKRLGCQASKKNGVS